MQLLGCQLPPLLLGLFQRLGHIVLPRGRLLLLLLAVHDFVDVGLLVGVCDFELALLGPLHLHRVFAGPRDYLMEIGLIVEVVSAFGDMSAILLTFLELEELPFLGLLDGVEVFLLEVVALDAPLVLVRGHRVQLVDRQHAQCNYYFNSKSNI